MNALDTNILVRYFVDESTTVEDKRQCLIARSLLAQPSYISLTVILELVWVLKSRYQLHKEQINQALALLCQMSHLTIERQECVEKALLLYLQGMDFADALHLVQAEHCQQFVTFDRKFASKAKRLVNECNVIIPE